MYKLYFYNLIRCNGRVLLMTLFLGGMMHFVSAQNDTLLYSILDSLVVTGYDSEQSIREVPGAIHVLGKRKLTAYDDESILTSMNSLPGIRLEQRSPGSYRLAIRGSTLRSPFGVRNIKVYWNGIPYTDPTGSTALNLLDNVNMDRIEILKGPAGSVYGAGTGGVLNIGSIASIRDIENQESVPDLAGGVQAGSYGFSKIELQKNFSKPNSISSIKFARQASAGYRDHTDFERYVGEFSGRYLLDNHHTLSTHLLFSSLKYQIPGGLNATQYDESPHLARQPSRFALGSEEAEAGVNQDLWLTGISHEYQSGKITHKTTVYGSFSPFDNPFNLDYKKDLRSSFGGRSRFDYKTSMGNGVLKSTLGTEYQHGFNVARNFENNYGKPGSLNFDDELTSDQWLLFGRLEYVFADSSFITAGVSRNFIEYGINRLVDASLDTSYQVIKSFDPVWVPRVGYSRNWNRFGWHASVSLGYSPPTIEDVRTNEGSINENLKPEIGINYETGIRGILWDKISLDWTVYYFNLNNTIVQQSTPRGTVIFENSGSTNQYGMETLIEGTFLAGRRRAQVWNGALSHTLHLYYFDEYTQFMDSELHDYSGNQLTGVPRHVISGDLNWQYNGFFLHGMVQAIGEIPLNDANTVFSSSYQDVSLKAGYRFTLRDQLESELFAGVRNALDQKYSLGNDLNAFGGRYFQPAAPRNYYVGWKFTL